MLLTFFVKYYAIKKSIIDIPNERSSHTIPTPRGGGIAVIIVFFIGLIYFKSNITDSLFYALWCSVPIVIVSLIDDIITLSSRSRLLVQSFSAIGALYFLGGIENIDFELFILSGWWLNILAFISIVWITNLYNFLDGIDGYAASQAIIGGLGVFLFFNNPLGLVIIVAALGFLLFNWDKASIFMGDVGSATLGFIFAVFCFSDTSGGNIYIWLILLSFFWYDATITLIRRYKNKEKITEPHRKHAYQRLTQSGWSHGKITLFFLSINLIFIILLLFSTNHTYLFILNIILLYFIMNFIDNKKRFEVN